jgi:hypothetical protein
MSDLAPILLALCKKTSYIIGAALRAALIGEAVRNRRAFWRIGALSQSNNKIFTDFSYLPCFAYQRSTNRSANNIGAA